MVEHSPPTHVPKQQSAKVVQQLPGPLHPVASATQLPPSQTFEAHSLACPQGVPFALPNNWEAVVEFAGPGSGRIPETRHVPTQTYVKPPQHPPASSSHTWPGRPHAKPASTAAHPPESAPPPSAKVASVASANAVPVSVRVATAVSAPPSKNDASWPPPSGPSFVALEHADTTSAVMSGQQSRPREESTPGKPILHRRHHTSQRRRL